MSLLDPILSPLLNISPFLAVLIVSLTLSIIITIVYKFMTDQELMKTLKADMKSMQNEMKELKNNPEKLMKKQKIAMEKNMKYMMHSMKPTLITFIPIILVFGWLNANFAYEPIVPGQEFDILVTMNKNIYGDIELIPPGINDSIEYLETDYVKQINSKEISFKFKAEQEGTWDLGFKVNNGTLYPISVKVDQEKYSSPEFKRFQGKDIKKIVVGNDKKIVLNLFGWEIGWLMAYIIFSIVFSLGLRKLLKLH